MDSCQGQNKEITNGCMKTLQVNEQKMNVTYQFDALDTGTTLVKIRVQGTARTFYGLADFLMAPMVKRNLHNDLRRLKAKMESE
jgi:hypothetical protein